MLQMRRCKAAHAKPRLHTDLRQKCGDRSLSICTRNVHKAQVILRPSEQLTDRLTAHDPRCFPKPPAAADLCDERLIVHRVTGCIAAVFRLYIVHTYVGRLAKRRQLPRQLDIERNADTHQTRMLREITVVIALAVSTARTVSRKRHTRHEHECILPVYRCASVADRLQYVKHALGELLPAPHLIKIHPAVRILRIHTRKCDLPVSHCKKAFDQLPEIHLLRQWRITADPARLPHNGHLPEQLTDHM